MANQDADVPEDKPPADISTAPSDNSTRWVIRARGLPYDATPEKLANFFSNCEIVGGKDGIHIKLTPEGNSSGEAYIELASEEDTKKAFENHNKHMGHRYVEVFQSNVSEMEWCLRQAQGSKVVEDSHVIRLRGLPWAATAADVAKFLHDVAICNGERGVHQTFTADGRSTGEAFVEVASEDQVEAALAHSKQQMGKRYVEVFRATKGQMEWAVVAQEEAKGAAMEGPVGVVRLRGLPYGCTQEKVIKFFAGLSIVPNGVIVQCDDEGRETGEAYVQLFTSQDAEKALEKHKNRIEHRYIEVFISCLADIKPIVPKSVPMMRPAPYDRPRGDYGGYSGMRGRASGYERQYRGGGGGGMGSPGFGDFGMGGPRMPGGGGLISYPQMRPKPPPGGMMPPGMMGEGEMMPRHEVRMRGLPYSASQNDIKNFFSPLIPQNVEIIFDETGRPTGEAVAFFVSHEDAVAAMKKDHEHMQHRYVELFLHSQPDTGGQPYNPYVFNSSGPANAPLLSQPNPQNTTPLMGGYSTPVMTSVLGAPPQQQTGLGEGWNEPASGVGNQQPSYGGYSVATEGNKGAPGYGGGAYGTGGDRLQQQQPQMMKEQQWYS